MILIYQFVFQLLNKNSSLCYFKPFLLYGIFKKSLIYEGLQLGLWQCQTILLGWLEDGSTWCAEQCPRILQNLGRNPACMTRSDLLNLTVRIHIRRLNVKLLGQNCYQSRMGSSAVASVFTLFYSAWIALKKRYRWTWWTPFAIQRLFQEEWRFWKSINKKENVKERKVRKNKPTLDWQMQLLAQNLKHRSD